MSGLRLSILPRWHGAAGFRARGSSKRLRLKSLSQTEPWPVDQRRKNVGGLVGPDNGPVGLADGAAEVT